MSRFRIIGLAAALLCVPLVTIEMTVHLSGQKKHSGTSSDPSGAQVLTTPIVAAKSTPSPTPSQAPSIAPKPAPQAKQTAATDAGREDIELIEQLHRELSSQRSQINELRRDSEKRQAEADKLAKEAAHSSTEALRAQFHDFAGRFVAAEDSRVQHSEPDPADPAGTRKLKVLLISDELTSTGADQLAKGVVYVKQSEQFQSYDGRITWSRDYTFEYLFEKKSDRWHCAGGSCRMTKDENSTRAGRSPWIGVAIPLGAEAWDSLDIR